jgi:hypothetical protein
MYISRKEAISALEDIEKYERANGILKTAGGIINIKNLRELKKDLEPSVYGVISIDVNERYFLSLRSRLSKISSEKTI